MVSEGCGIRRREAKGTHGKWPHFKIFIFDMREDSQMRVGERGGRESKRERQ